MACFSSFAQLNDRLTCKPIVSVSTNGQSRFVCSARQISLRNYNNKIFVVSCGSVPKHAKICGEARNHDRIRNSSLGVRAATTSEREPKQYPVEKKGFEQEMRHVAMRLHTRDVVKEGTKEPDAQPIEKWEPTIQGYLKFLVDSKLVYDTLEDIVQKATHPAYAELRNTGLERSENLAKDLEWFRQQGYSIPGPSRPGTSYANYLQDLSEQDPPAFICHFYNFYFAHTAGGQMIGKKVAEKILDGKELEFYKWDGDIKKLLNDVREKINKAAEDWSREEKNHCLEETEKSFAYSGEILRLIVS